MQKQILMLKNCSSWNVHNTRAEQCIHEDSFSYVEESANDTEMLTFEQALATPLLTTNVVEAAVDLQFDFKAESGCMHMWHEGVSRLLHHLRKMQTQATKLILYSDSCGGQNRNIDLVCLWMHIVSSPDTQIDQKFIVSGDSYLPNDRDCASIETANRQAGQVYAPEE